MGFHMEKEVVKTPTTISNDPVYLLTAVVLTPGGSSTVHIYTQKGAGGVGLRAGSEDL